MLPKWGVVWQTKGFARDEVIRTRCCIMGNTSLCSNDTRSGKRLASFVLPFPVGEIEAPCAFGTGFLFSLQ